MRSHGKAALSESIDKPGLRMKQDAEPPTKYSEIMIIQVVLRVFRTFSYYGTVLLSCPKGKLWLLFQ